ncbi:copper radical oxidase [Coccidioides posadasii str. Silveira]|uniref:Copper radical oxidase n=2 Tax=Coccidioides posadasii (strain RMSCC 757 / Silveira) TaxID=443226 RepID=E9DJ77_COCPS|nr:copper radical oxidase [Coccidioides posadasii str. Silveira]
MANLHSSRAARMLAFPLLFSFAQGAALFPRADPNDWKYLGCYTDSVGARTLSNVGYTLGGPSNMTVENCENACMSEGYVYAGVEYSGECWCDNELRNGGPAPDGEEKCTMPCNGNPQQNCGGPDRLNLYQNTAVSPSTGPTTAQPTITSSPTDAIVSTTPVSSSTRAVPTALPTGWDYAGCYVDNTNGRIMERQLPDDPKLTIESCVSRCAGMGYVVAGTQFSRQCFCDNYVRKEAALADDSNCSMSCAGDTSEKCGGPNRMSVYSKGDLTVLPNPEPQTGGLPGSWEYQGCLEDNVNQKRTFPYQIIDKDNNSAINCLSRCSMFGFGAGGMTYGEECFCGDVADIGKAGAKLVPESRCSMTCPGNETAICGAGNLITYYKWTGSPLQTWSFPSGNAAGRYEFLIGGVVVSLMTTVGINGKITFQEKFGTGDPNTTGAYEFDPAFEKDFSKAWRPMHVKTDIFCSGGLVLPDRAGRQLTVGGWSGTSTHGVRLYWPDGSPGKPSVNDWQENPDELALQDGRWYPSAMIMANGSILIVGGEEGSNGPPVPTLEILPRVGPALYMDWLERTDPNNLYPFLTPLPSGDIFAAYYNEARILDEKTSDTVKTLPNMPGAVNNDEGGRTYPLEGTMVLLPQHAPYTDPLGVLLCGGSTPFGGNAIDNCVSIQPEVPNSKWVIERMPSKRVLTCMAGLPDGTFLILNGAKEGVAGFGLAKDPNLNAVLYDPSKPVNQRMSVMGNTTIARMYHSEAILIPDGRVLVSGSDPEDPDFPQEYRVEVFLPPYLLSGAPRPTFTIQDTDWAYGQNYKIEITSGNTSKLRVSLLGLVSSTHGNSFGSRTIFPAVSCSGTTCTITAPPDSHTCPPGWFMLFVLDGPTPSVASFVRIGGDPGRLGDWPAFPDFDLPGVD